MIKKILLVGLISLSNIAYAEHVTDLMDIYRQALVSDPVYQQALAQRLYTKQGVPINLSSLLPNLSLLGVPSLTKSTNSGSTVEPFSNTTKQYIVNLSLTQTIFDMGKIMALSGAQSLSKEADAILNTETQNLMTRVSKAYFAVLQDEDNLRYAAGAKNFYSKQYDQVKQQYEVGIKTVTDVYTAQASFSSASASYIAAETQIENDKENLRAITGVYYPNLAKLSDNFPLVSPHPADIDAWVTQSIQHNWSIKASQYSAEVALQNIKQQMSGHLPTLNVAGNYINTFQKNTGDSIVIDPGPNRQIDRAVALNLNVPIFSGGLVVAETNQAQYGYQKALQNVEQTQRAAINMARQSYLNVISAISQISADKQAIKSSRSSLEGLDASYRVGTGTLVDVLNQQQNLLNAEKNYASDRYSYITSLLSLKKAAGTLSADDLQAINAWLIDNEKKETVKK